MTLNRKATNREASPNPTCDAPSFTLDTQAINEKVGYLNANRSEGAATFIAVAQKACTHSTAGHICPDCFRDWIGVAFEEGLDAGTALTCKAVDRRLPDILVGLRDQLVASIRRHIGPTSTSPSWRKR